MNGFTLNQNTFTRMGIKSNQTVRVVNKYTGKASEQIALYANDPIWQKRTGNYPQPAPKAEEFRTPVVTTTAAASSAKQETKKENNEATKTV